MMVEILQYEFMRNALAAGLLASIACGIIGTYVVIKRIVFISGGISHSAYGGIGLGYFFGFNPILGAAAFSLISAVGIGIIDRKTAQRADTLIGVVWALGMSIGIIFVGMAPGYAPDLTTYLFGSILAVPTADLMIMALLDVIICLTVVLLYKEFLVLSFDEEFSSVVCTAPQLIYLVLFCLIALTVVVLIRVVGIILVIAMLAIPPAVSGQYTTTLSGMMFCSVVLGVIFTAAGLIISYYFDFASGATIVLVAGVVYLITAAHAHVCGSKKITTK